MKKLISFLAFCAASLLLSAAEVDLANALTVAQNFANEAFARQKGQSLVSLNPQIKYTMRNGDNKPLLYFVNVEPTGYLIISADDRCYPVLSYSDDEKWDDEKWDDLPPGALFFINNYAEEIEIVINSNMIASNEIKELWDKYSDFNKSDPGFNRSTVTLARMGDLAWNQNRYYNQQCPQTGGSHPPAMLGYDNRCPAGCVAVPMAQILRYWQWPVIGNGTNSYTDPENSANNPCALSDPSYGTQSVNFGSTIYNYANMPNSISSHNADVAGIIWHAGVAINTDYAYCSSSSTSGTARDAYVNRFRYSSSANYRTKTINITWNTWEGYIMSDIDLGRPVHYRGEGYLGGHAFVCWAYENLGSYARFKFNWGWGGNSNNTWYTLRSVTGENYNLFPDNQAMINDLFPTNASIAPCNYLQVISGTGSSHSQTYIGGGNGSWHTSSNNPCGFPSPGIEQVYEFVAPASGTYSVQVTSASGKINYMWKSGSCSSAGWNCIGGIASTGTYGSMSWTAGTTYYILLDDEDNIPGLHTFYINTPVLPPNMTLTPTSHNFENVNVGSNSTNQNFTLTNTGSSAVSGSVDLDIATQFTIVSGGGSFHLVVGDSKTIVVHFSPTSQGIKTDGLKAIVSGNSLAISSISGTGTYPSVPVDRIVQGIDVLPGQIVCFDALNSIVVAGGGTNFLVRNGGSAYFVAGQIITFLPDTWIMSGGYIHAYITTDGSYCSQTSSKLASDFTDESEENEINLLSDDTQWFSIYPNPATNSFTLKLHEINNVTTINISIYNLTGEIVLQTELVGYQSYLLDVSTMPRGMYVVKVNVGSVIGVEKLII